jgi:succinylglutamic semialdehyde dehydrogenase
MATAAEPRALGNFINGRFELPTDPNGELAGRNPSDQTEALGRFPYSYRAVDRAVGVAREAFLSWRKTPWQERSALIRRLQEALGRNRELLAEAIAREIGKPLWDAHSELRSALSSIDVFLEEGMRFVADFELSPELGDCRGACRHRPLGVIAVITPFSAPVEQPIGMLVPALLTGNTLLLKPSERTPWVGQLLAQCFEEAGFPKGVVALLQGEKETGRRLAVHEQVDGVLFAGTYETGMRIKQDTLLQHWKLLVQHTGGKNPMLVWEDADLELALHEALMGVFSSAGQRSTATSRIIIHERICEEFVSRLHERAKAFSIGHALENPFMGPLIEQGSVDRYQKFQGIATREGCELIMRGKGLEWKHAGHYVTPSICWVRNATLERARKSVYQQTELYAPNAAVLGVLDLEEAIAQANLTQYGLVASVFTRDRAVYSRCLEGLSFGVVNWNRATISVSPRLPIGGLKKSGNHLAAGVVSARNCMVPVSSLEVESPRLPASLEPGLNWLPTKG